MYISKWSYPIYIFTHKNDKSITQGDHKICSLQPKKQNHRCSLLHMTSLKILHRWSWRNVQDPGPLDAHVYVDQNTFRKSRNTTEKRKRSMDKTGTKMRHCTNDAPGTPTYVDRYVTSSINHQLASTDTGHHCCRLIILGSVVAYPSTTHGIY